MKKAVTEHSCTMIRLQYTNHSNVQKNAEFCEVVQVVVLHFLGDVTNPLSSSKLPRRFGDPIGLSAAKNTQNQNMTI